MKNIKKVLTALMNENVNNELRKHEDIKVISNDLLYQEAVIEYINENKEIDFLLLNENLPGERIENFIDKINQIKIILFVEKSTKKEEILLQKGVYKIFTNGEVSVEEIYKIIKKDEDEYTQKLKNEIENLKRKIEKQEKIKEDNKIKNYFKYMSKYISKQKNIDINNKIISITGNNEQTKAIFSISLAKQLEKRKTKILLIDFDILNQNIHTLLNIKNKEEKNLKIENHIINKSKYLSILSGRNILFKINEQITTYEIEQIIEKLKIRYQYIIINTSSECFFEIHKKILEKTDTIFFVVENTLKNIEISINLLKIYFNNWKIDKDKFTIILSQTQKLKDKLKINILEKIPYFIRNQEIEKNQKIKYKKIDFKKINL